MTGRLHLLHNFSTRRFRTVSLKELYVLCRRLSPSLAFELICTALKQNSRNKMKTT